MNTTPEFEAWFKEYWVQGFNVSPLDVARRAAWAAWQARSRYVHDDARKALAELVACKDLKERIKKLDDPMNWKDPPELEGLCAEYEERQPKAWAEARRICESSGAPK